MCNLREDEDHHIAQPSCHVSSSRHLPFLRLGRYRGKLRFGVCAARRGSVRSESCTGRRTAPGNIRSRYRQQAADDTFFLIAGTNPFTQGVDVSERKTVPR